MFIKIILILILLLVPLPSLGRDLEIEYPAIPGTTPLGPESGLDHYIDYIYYFIITLTGIVALGAFIWGGFIYLTSGGSPGKMQRGKSRIMGGLGGLAIILAAHLILNTINPQLLGGELIEPELPRRGYCLRGHEFDWWAGLECPEQWEKTGETDCLNSVGNPPEGPQTNQCCQIEPRIYCFNESTSKVLPAGFIAEEIAFRELWPSIERAYFFPEEGFQGSSRIISNSVRDLEEELWRSIDLEKPKSVYIIRYRTGFYLYPVYACRYDFSDFRKNMPLYAASPRSDLGDHRGRTISIERRVMGEGEDWRENIPWGAILTSRENFSGDCGIIFGANLHQHTATPINGMIPNGAPHGDTRCFSATNLGGATVRSAFNDKHGAIRGGTTSTTDGTNIYGIYPFRRKLQDVEGKVVFYQDSNYGSVAQEIHPSDLESGNHAEHTFPRGNTHHSIWVVNLDYDSDHKNKWGQENILSVRVSGDFLVVMNTEHDFTGRCSVFTESVPDLRSRWVLRRVHEGDRIKSIAIIPYQK